MTIRNLPTFRPVTKEELRRIWTDYPAPEVRRMALEIERSRRVMVEVEALFSSIHDAWKKEMDGTLVAIHLLKTLLADEKDRRPY